jgi:hypothetical protein
MPSSVAKIKTQSSGHGMRQIENSALPVLNNQPITRTKDHYFSPSSFRMTLDLLLSILILLLSRVSPFEFDLASIVVVRY